MKLTRRRDTVEIKQPPLVAAYRHIPFPKLDFQRPVEKLPDEPAAARV